MTIRGVGKPVPSQLYLMMLAGLVTERWQKIREPTEQQVRDSQKKGHEALCRMTGQDFGDDVNRWYEYLIVNNFGLKHPYGYGALRRFLLDAGFAAPPITTAPRRLVFYVITGFEHKIGFWSKCSVVSGRSKDGRGNASVVDAEVGGIRCALPAAVWS